MLTPHFSEKECECHCGCGDDEMSHDYMEILERIRLEMKRPLNLSSAKRCPAHNMKVSKTGRHGPHTFGRAVDVLISGADALRLVEVARKYGMSGIGLQQRGPHNKRFVHIDNLGIEYTKLTGGPRPWLWSYA